MGLFVVPGALEILSQDYSIIINSAYSFEACTGQFVRVDLKRQ